MADSYSNGELVAAARVSAAGAFVGNPRGMSGVVLAGNVFTITLAADGLIDALDALVLVGSNAATPNQPVWVQTSDTTIEVRCFDEAGVAADEAFSIGVWRKFGGFQRTPMGTLWAMTNTPVGGGVTASKNIASVSAPAVSVYTVTLAKPIDANDSIIIPCIQGATPGMITAVQSSDTVILVSTFSAAGAPADRAFQLGVFSKQDIAEIMPVGQLVVASQVDGLAAQIGNEVGITPPVTIPVAGTYRRVAANLIDNTEQLILASLNLAAGVTGFVQVQSNSDSEKDVNTTDVAGAAAARANSLGIWRHRVGSP